MQNSHQGHSSAIRHLRFATGRSAHLVTSEEGASYTLESPHSGYVVRITFTALVDDPGLMRVRATNWRAEHEPNLVASLDECRTVWKSLKAGGFVEKSS